MDRLRFILENSEKRKVPSPYSEVHPEYWMKSSMLGGAFSMTKYSHEFRIYVIQELERGKSATGLAKKYGITRKAIRGWWANYCESGIEGLIGVRKKYSEEFKLYAIEFRKAHELSYLHAAAQLGIPHEGTLFAWVSIPVDQDRVSGANKTPQSGVIKTGRSD